MTTTDMKRYTSLKSNLFSPHSSSIVSQNLVYMQMSHHYRRLLNAKSNVDSSQPRSFRTQERTRRSHRLLHIDSSDSSFVDEPSPSEMALVDRIVNDDKHRPDVIYRDHLAGAKNHNHPYPPAPPRHDCTGPRRATERPKQNQRCRQSCIQRTANKPAPCDLIDRHCDVFECADPYKPRILKSTAQSRVRDLKVYHPPRRKPKSHKTEDWVIKTEVQQQLEDEHVMEANNWLQSQTVQTDIEPPRPLCAQCQCDIHPSSKVSIGSRDSAYNGGVSSGGESRGPTPEQINLANLSTSSSRPTGRRPSMRTTTDRKVDREKRIHRPSSCSSARQCVRNSNKMTSTDRQVPGLNHSTARDDMRYAAFSQRITADILSREILSNKGINQVFQRHLEENRELLDMTLMQKEIDMLRDQLDLGANEDSDKNINLDSRETLSTESIILSTDSSIPPKLGSDFGRYLEKEGASSSLLNSSYSHISTSLFHTSNTYTNNSNVSSNLSGLLFPPQSGNIPCDVFYPSCHAPCSSLNVPNQLVQAGDHSQNVEMPSAPKQNELQLSPFEILSLNSNINTTIEDSLNVVSTEMETHDSDSKVFTPEGVMGSSSNTSDDSSSLKDAIKGILEQILVENIPSIIAEPVVIESNNEALDNETNNLSSDSEHSEKLVLSNLENDVAESESAEESLFKNGWVSKHSDCAISENKDTGLHSCAEEDNNADSSSTGVLTRCCFIKKKKKLKDVHKPTNVISPHIEKNKLGRSENKETETNTTKISPLSDEELSWEAMAASKSSNPPAVTSTSLSSKSSLGPTPSKPVEPPRVRKLSDSTTRRRSTYLEVLSSSSSSTSDNSTCAVKNFQEQVRRSNEAHKIKSDAGRSQNLNQRRKPAK